MYNQLRLFKVVIKDSLAGLVVNLNNRDSLSITLSITHGVLGFWGFGVLGRGK